MKQDSKQQNDSFLGIGVLVAGLLVFIIGLMYCHPDKDSANRQVTEYVEYNIPTYVTVYEIVYPDSVYRYEATHHSPSHLSSSRGSNYLGSAAYYSKWTKGRPDYWLDEWNSNELSVSTTAPIRIVSETVSWKKVKYQKKH